MFGVEKFGVGCVLGLVLWFCWFCVVVVCVVLGVGWGGESGLGFL